jgi:hypothetical protein
MLSRSLVQLPGPTGYDLPGGANRQSVHDGVMAPIREQTRSGARAAVAPALMADPARLAQQSAIEALASKSGDFMFEGQIFRVIPGADWGALASDERYQLIPYSDARNLLKRMAAVPVIPPAQKAALQGVAMLMEDSRLGRIDKGLLLLRLLPMRSVRAAAVEAPITPSQFRKLLKNDKAHWLDFRFKDSGGRPLPGAEYHITLPDGSDRKGHLNSQGKLHYEEQSSGDATVEILDIDAANWGKDEVDAHEQVELSAQVCRGYAPGETVNFDICRLYRERDADVVASFTGRLDHNGRALVRWTPSSIQFPDDRFVFSASIRKVWRKSQPLAVRHRVVSAEWASVQAREGDAITLRAVLRGVSDGESATLRIFEKQWRGGQNTMIETLSAVVNGGEVEATWTAPAAAAPPPRGDSGRRDFHYTLEAAGLQCTSTHVVVFPAQHNDGTMDAA